MTGCRHKGTTITRTGTGYDVRLEDTELTPLTELTAVLTGRQTYTRHVGSGEVYWRAPATIRARPAGTHPRQTVHAGHRCPPAPSTSTTLTPGAS